MRTRSQRLMLLGQSMRRTHVTRQRGVSQVQRWLVTVVVLIGGLGAVAGCSPREAGAAVLSEDRRITTDEVATAVSAFTTSGLIPDDQQAVSAVVYFLVLDPHVRAVANQAGVPIPSDEELAQEFGASLDPSPEAIVVYRTAALLNQFGTDQPALQQEVRTLLNEESPTVNPRYGTFDLNTVNLTPAAPNWLVPTASPSAPAEAVP
ncbi:MAG: hypothetical protein ACRCTR_03315 [Actinomycetota bacterium]